MCNVAAQAMVTKEHMKLQQLCISIFEAINAAQGQSNPKMAKAPFDAYCRF